MGCEYTKNRVIKTLRNGAKQLESVDINDSTVDIVLGILDDISFYCNHLKNKMIKESVSNQ